MAEEESNRQENLDALLGKMAIRRGLLTNDQLRSALAEQGRDIRSGKSHPRPLGIILVSKGFVTDEQLLSLLEEQKSKTQELQTSKKQDSLLGRILVQKSQITQQQLNECLGVQSASLEDGEEEVPRLGALLIKKGYVSPSAIMHALAAQQKTVMMCEACDLKFNVQNFNPANPIHCPSCKTELKAVSEDAKVEEKKESLSATGTKELKAGAHPAPPPPQPPLPGTPEAEMRAKAEALRQDAELRAKAEASRQKLAQDKVRAEAEAKAKAEEEARAKAQAEALEAARIKAEAEAKSKAEADAKARKKAEDDKARVEALRQLAEKARIESESKAKAEADKKKTDEDKKAREKAEADAKAKAIADKKKADEDKKTREKAEADAKAKADADKKKADEDKKAREKAEADAKAEAEKKKADKGKVRVETAATKTQPEEEGSPGVASVSPDVEVASVEAESANRRTEDRAREEAEAMARAVEERRRLKTMFTPATPAANADTSPVDAPQTAAKEIKVPPQETVLPAPLPRKKTGTLWAAVAAGILALLGGGGYYLYTLYTGSIEKDLKEAQGYMERKEYSKALSAYGRVLGKQSTNAQALAGQDLAQAKLNETQSAAVKDAAEKARKDELDKAKAREDELKSKYEAAEKTRLEELAKAKAAEDRLTKEKEDAKNLADKDRAAAEARIKEAEANLAKQLDALKRAEQEKARAEEARLAALKDKKDAEEKARIEKDRLAAEQKASEEKIRQAEKAAAEQSLTTAVLLSDRGEFDAAYKELDKCSKAGVDPVPVGRRIVQKELSALFAKESAEEKVRGYTNVITAREAYLNDDLRNATIAQLLILSPPPGLVYAEKNAQGQHEFKLSKDGSVLVLVPGGEFLMGADGGDENEKPARKVYVDGFLLDKTEVTVEQFRRFVEATRYVTEAEKSGGADVLTGGAYEARPDASWKKPYFAQEDTHPVTCVSWSDAVDYCKWAGKRLPTEAEWEKATRGADGRKFPWGSAAVGDGGTFRANVKGADDGFEQTAPVGSFPTGISPYGILDLSGNVAEWCADWYDEAYYKKAPPRNPAGPSSGTFRIRRGGSWFVDAERCRSSARVWSPPVDKNSITGFRCARDIK